MKNATWQEAEKELKEQLTNEQKFQADKMAKIAFGHILDNERKINEISKMFVSLRYNKKILIPCDYESNKRKSGDTHSFQPFLRQLFDDIINRKIILK